MDITQQNFETDLKRDRAWRHTSTLWKAKKNCKLLYQRSLKQKRAMQLGFAYPRISAELFKRKVAYDYWNPTD